MSFLSPGSFVWIEYVVLFPGFGVVGVVRPDSTGPPPLSDNDDMEPIDPSVGRRYEPVYDGRFAM